MGYGAVQPRPVRCPCGQGNGAGFQATGAAATAPAPTLRKGRRKRPDVTTSGRRRAFANGEANQQAGPLAQRQARSNLDVSTP